MDMLCPECMGPMVSSDGREAVCTLDGKRFQILFTRTPMAAAAPPALPTAPAVDDGDTYELSLDQAVNPLDQLAAANHRGAAMPAGATCRSHLGAPAVAFCDSCGTPVCSTCDFPLANGAHVCPNCASDPARVASARPSGMELASAYQMSQRQQPYSVPATFCRVHPENPAVAYCRNCAAPVCTTCDFQFPNNVHLCAACAAKPPERITPKRKKLLIWAYCLAAWTTLGIIALMAGAFKGMKAEEAGIILQIFVFVPALVGIGVAFGSLDKRLGNTASVWVAVIWNAIILVILLLLTVIGLTMHA
jgi:hypothetical protein